MRFITAVLAISPGALFARVTLATAPVVTQAMVTEAGHDQYRQQAQVQDQDIHGGVPKRKLQVNDFNPCVNTIVEIQMDMHPDQISWTIANECTGATVAVGPMGTSPNTLFSGTYCLPPAAYQFVIRDSLGEGLTGSGAYAVYFGGAPITSGGQFGLSASANFGSCS